MPCYVDDCFCFFEVNKTLFGIHFCSLDFVKPRNTLKMAVMALGSISVTVTSDKVLKIARL